MSRSCDWCDEAATVAIQDGAACPSHTSELERVAAGRIWRSGNPFAGEAAEALVDGASANRRCVAPIGDQRPPLEERLCGRSATTTRIVENVECPLCEEHARECDSDEEEEPLLQRIAKAVDGDIDGETVVVDYGDRGELRLHPDTVYHGEVESPAARITGKLSAREGGAYADLRDKLRAANIYPL